MEGRGGETVVPRGSAGPWAVNGMDRSVIARPSATAGRARVNGFKKGTASYRWSGPRKHYWLQGNAVVSAITPAWVE